MNRFVRGLSIDGMLLPLTWGFPTNITMRGGSLLKAVPPTARTSKFTLNNSFISGQEFFLSGATLTATLVPEPSSLALSALALSTGLGLALRRRYRGRKAAVSAGH